VPAPRSKQQRRRELPDRSPGYFIAWMSYRF